MNGETVLVTGAGGFVGSAVVRRLVGSPAWFDDGTPVSHVVAVLRPNGSSGRLETLPDDGSWSIMRADTADPVSLGSVLDGLRPRAIIHAALDAAAYSVRDEQLVTAPLETIVHSLQRRPDARLIHVGSAWVLRTGDHLEESALLDARTPYAWNKALADRLLAERADRAGVPWINLRLFNVFGRYEQSTRLLPTLVSQLSQNKVARLTHATQIRDFTDVDVMAGVFVQALAAPREACGAVYHVGSGKGTTVREFAYAVADIVGNADQISFGQGAAYDTDVPCLVADPSRAIEALGWKPDVDLGARIAEAAEWWLDRLDNARPTSEVLT